MWNHLKFISFYSQVSSRVLSPSTCLFACIGGIRETQVISTRWERYSTVQRKTLEVSNTKPYFKAVYSVSEISGNLLSSKMTTANWQNWQKSKVALNPFDKIVWNFAKSFTLSFWLQFHNKKWGMGVTELVFGLQPVKRKIRGVSNRLYCCYGNLLCRKNYLNLFTKF